MRHAFLGGPVNPPSEVAWVGGRPPGQSDPSSPTWDVSWRSLVVLTAAALLSGSRSKKGRDRQMEAFFDSPGSARFLLDPSRRIVRANPSAHEAFRQRPGELTGRLLAEFVAPESQDALDRVFRAADSSRSSSPPTRLAGAPWIGPGAAWEIVVSPLPGDGGGGYTAFLRGTDATDALVAALAERGAELARSNRDLQEFVHIASHDLQEPLRMVRSFTELVAQRYIGRLDPRADEYLAFAQEGASRMQELLDALVAYARIDSRGRPFEPLSMNACLTDSLDDLRLTIRDSGATVEQGKLPDVEGDATQLTQVFQNLLANAIKFRRSETPTISVRGVDEGPSVLYSVTDNGIGIPAEYREKIFLIFQRLHSREQYPGTGVGLAICKKVVERHGGKIWVEGHAPSGSVFYFRLPKQHRPPPPEPAIRSRTSEPSARRHAEELIMDRMRELA